MTNQNIQNNKPVMSNRTKIIAGLALITILIIVGTLLIYPIVDTNTRFEQYKEGFNNDPFYGSGQQCKYRGGYEEYIKYSDRQIFELDELNLLQPRYAFVQDVDVSDKTGNQLFQDISFITFQRNGAFSFRPIAKGGASIRNKTLDETVQIIKKYNLLEENPDPKNITVVPPKSDEELAKIAEQYCNQEQPDFSDDDTPSFNELPPDEIRAGLIELANEKQKLLEERETATPQRQAEIDSTIIFFDELVKIGEQSLREQEGR